VSTDGTGVDNRLVAIVGAKEHGDESTRNQIGTFDVDLLRLPPLVRLAVADFLVVFKVSRIVEDKIQTAEFLFNGFGSVGCALSAGDVEGESDDVRFGLVGLFGGGFDR
jgi:hypothetical protein